MSVVVETAQFDELYCPTCEHMFPRTAKVCPEDGARLVKLSVGPDPFIGRELDGRFTVIEKLGEGGMGAVYRAHQHSVDREVAIKVLHANLVSDTDTIKRFLREAKLTSKLSHPNAVAVLDFGQTDDGVMYLVMELVPGKTLDTVQKVEGALGPARVIKIGLQICDALDTAHAMQIVHRDLKPANIMLVEGRRDFVKVLDFGLAKMLERKANQSHEETLLGTPAFFPPERATGIGDERSDLYSLGCMLYLVASGTLPFRADTPKDLVAAVVAAHQSRRPTPLANVPPNLARVIDRLLQKKPDDRYQTAAETHAALEEAAALDGITAYQSSPSIEQARISMASMRASQPSIETPTVLPEIERPPRRKLAIAIGAGIAVVAILIAIIVSSGGGSESAKAAAPSTPESPTVIEAKPAGTPVAKPEVKPDAEAKSVETPRPEAKPDVVTKPDPAKPKPIRKPGGGKPATTKLPF
jgi:eukaryotic-like serine/threonine-protein kinase